MNKSTIGILAFAAGVAAARAADTPTLHSTVVTWTEIQGREATNGGRSRAVVRAPTATLEELESHITTLGPGEQSHPPHRHPQEEIVVLKEGTLEAYLEGRTERVDAGGFLFLASNEEHAVKNVGTTPAVYYVIQFRTKAAAR